VAKPRIIPEPLPGHLTEAGVITSFAQRMMYTVAKDVHTATDADVYTALAYSVRDRLMERWFKLRAPITSRTRSASITCRWSS
jgi:glucan phosphorylase